MPALSCLVNISAQQSELVFGYYHLCFPGGIGIYGIKMFECVKLEGYEKNYDIFA